VAAVIVTPEVNFFPHDYIRELQALVRQLGALLILDEVMTGFRYAWGGYHTAAGVQPDLIALSKGLANGVALSAVGGREEVMRADERTYLGNTYQREVTPFAAALATMDAWAQTEALARTAAVGMRLMAGLNTVFTDAGVEAWALAWPTMFDVVFAHAPTGHLFFEEMWRRRFLMQYGGRFMPSAATDDRDVDAALDASVHALRTALNRSGKITGDGFGPATAQFAADYLGATAQTVSRWCHLQLGAVGSGNPPPADLPT
jgi:glutamate-1-semialdehyde aminotransferase